jgi:hypothetical protein
VSVDFLLDLRGAIFKQVKYLFFRDVNKRQNLTSWTDPKRVYESCVVDKSDDRRTNVSLNDKFIVFFDA